MSNNQQQKQHLQQPLVFNGNIDAPQIIEKRFPSVVKSNCESECSMVEHDNVPNRNTSLTISPMYSIQQGNKQTDSATLHPIKGLNPALKDTATDLGNTDINIQQPEVNWRQTETHVILYIHIAGLQRCKLSISGKCLKLEAVTDNLSSLGGSTKPVEFCFNLFGEVVDQDYQCVRLNESNFSIKLEKAKNSQVHWPRLIDDEEQENPTDHPYNSLDDQVHRVDNLRPVDNKIKNKLRDADRSCFEDIELYLSQLVRQQIPGSVQKDNKRDKKVAEERSISRTNDFDTNLKAAFKKYYNSSSSSASGKSKTAIQKDFAQQQSIRPPEYDSEIFNPFKRGSHNLRTRRSMKYDYRRDAAGTASGSSSVIDSGKNTAKYALDYRKTYLFLYNLVLFVMFLMVFMILVIKVLSDTIDDDTVRGAAFIIKLLTYTQLLESIHPILGLVPGGPMMPLLQVIGRLIVNHFLSEPTIRINSAPYAHYLFIVWSCIEIFRYSFYALRVFKVDVYPITWCRYTLFMPLYPMGGFCESMVVMATIKYYGKTGTYSVAMPNAANISFHLPSFLKFYIYFLLAPSIMYLIRYMWSQRCKQLSKKEKLA